MHNFLTSKLIQGNVYPRGRMITVAQHVFHVLLSVTLFKNRKAYCNIRVDIDLIKCLDMDLNSHFMNDMSFDALGRTKEVI